MIDKLTMHFATLADVERRQRARAKVGPTYIQGADGP
jgi:hypothetical protein